MGKKKDKIDDKATKDRHKLGKSASEQKNYAFSSSSAAQPPSAAADNNNSAVQVKLSGQLEEAMLDLIKKEMLGTCAVGYVSQRLNARKLTDMYEALRATGFTVDEVERAMTATVCRGGDLHDALDWLCLNLSNDQLPSGFSQALQKDDAKQRQPLSQEDMLQRNEVVDRRHLGAEHVEKASADESDVVSTKDWILQYAACQSDSDDDEYVRAGEEQICQSKDKEMDDSSDANARYLELTAHLLDLRSEMASEPTASDPQSMRNVHVALNQVIDEMKSVEQLPGFDRHMKLKDVDLQKMDISASNPENPDMSASDTEKPMFGGLLEEDSLNLFDEEAAEAERPERPILEKPPVAALKRRQFAYTRQQWTGKSPKQFLTDWTRKNLPKTASLSFERVDAGGGWWRARCRVKRGGKDGDVMVCPDIVCDNLKDAEHLASTLALYHLCRGQRVYQLLPPPYRTVWLEWLDAEVQETKKVALENTRPREEFISRLLSMLKPQPCTSPGDAASSTEDFDSWEDRLNDEDDTVEVESCDVAPDHRSSSSSSSSSRRCPAARLKALVERRRGSPAYRQMLAERQQLPVYQHRDDIVAALRRHAVFIVAGETGSGKSTQVPQFILEELIMTSDGETVRHVICTEPRRISAVSLADRVSAELGETSGPGRHESLCGYQIRFESRQSKSTRLTYCTTGVLLRRLHDDADLRDVACIIVDEVHERSVESDFLLIYLQRLCRRRSDLRVIMMSATLDAQKFSKYFAGCPVVNIPGQSYPVEVFYLEDVVEKTGYRIDEESPYSLRLHHLIKIEETRISVTSRGKKSSVQQVLWTKDDLSAIDQSDIDKERYSLPVRNTVTRMNPNKVNFDLIVDILHLLDNSEEFAHCDGAVLVFLPGLSHIQRLYQILEADSVLGNSDRFMILGLHSSLSSAEQSKVFLVPPCGVRKIVLATNIAETGVTIPDVVFVIDSGRVKENRYTELTQMSELVEVSVSKASSRQRCGRAGRVREGVCFRLFSRPMYDRLSNYSIPEMLRVPLEELCLHIMKCDLGSPSEFLSSALDPPAWQAISRAMSILHEVGACITDCVGGQSRPALTALGQHLSVLPVSVRLAKMLVYAAVFGCQEPAAVIAACVMDKSPFVTSVDKRSQSDAAKSRLALGNSDQLTLYSAFVSWKAARKLGAVAERTYCEGNCLKQSSLMEIENVSNELIRMVKDAGFVTTLADMVRAWNSRCLSAAFKELVNTAKPDLTSSIPSPALMSILKAVLAAGLYPRIGQVSYVEPVDAAANPTRRTCVVRTSQGDAEVHPTSVNRYLATTGWITYHEKLMSAQCVYVRDVTLVSPWSLLMFGGDISIQHQHQLISVDGFVTLKASAKTGVIFKQIRKLLDSLLQQKLENPSLNLTEKPLVRLLVELLVSETTAVSAST